MIYLMRHGLDDERSIGGHSDVSLTKEGIKQVSETADFIVNKSLFINRIYTSDIKRAVETAEIINNRLKAEIIKASYLRELDKGDLTGKPKEYAHKYYSEYTNIKDINKKYPNGESLLDLYKRIKNNLPTILKEDNTLMVTHRGVINMIYFILNNE